ncbi:MAG: DNA helicase RecQ [Pseudomonadota bacterium]
MTMVNGLLQSVFGFSEFRPGQREIVEAVVRGDDVLAIMPTGGGKSLCYQLPALVRDGITLVVSPLIALMRDQVRALQEAGVPAAALTSANSREETDALHARLEAGTLRLLYLAPERIGRPGTAEWLARAGIGLIAVDEAHCVSQWGHDFRPDYLAIGDLRRALGCPLAAFTATADAETRQEIARRLFDGAPTTFLRGFDRPNLTLAFLPKDRPLRQILDFVGARAGQSGIVYCSARARTEAIARELCDAGHLGLAYHAGLEPDQRREAETRFQREDGMVMVATVAFGMGIDKPDIRYVVHADLPKSIEAYYQEIGRAGRDGAPAETLALYGADDIRLRRAQIDESAAPDDRKRADHARLNALLALAESPVCRRQPLLGYFGEIPGEPCGNCDICLDPPPTFDATIAAQKAFSAALRTEERFGAGHLIDILRGQMSDKMAARGHDRLPTFGVGQEYSRSEWSVIFRQLQGLDLLRPDASRHGALRLTEAARPILRGESPLTLRSDTLKRAAKSPRPKAAAPSLGPGDEPLLQALKARRRDLADAAKVPAYVIFPDRTLIDMVARRPRSLEDMRHISGIGETKLARYGQTFLEILQAHP